MINKVNSTPTFTGTAILRRGKDLVAAEITSGTVDAMIKEFANDLSPKGRFRNPIDLSRPMIEYKWDVFLKYLGEKVFPGADLKPATGKQCMSNMAGIKSVREEVSCDFITCGDLNDQHPKALHIMFKF